MLTFDGKGVTVRPQDLRPATSKAAARATRKLSTPTKGEKRNRKRMAQVAAIYDVAPWVRTRWTCYTAVRRPNDVGGRPPLEAKVVEIILTLKRENPAWGQRRIQEELRRMRIRVSQPTIMHILKENGLGPRPGRKVDFERVKATVKDAAWALDFFAVKTAKGVWLQALLIIYVYTRELIDLRVYDGWDVDSVWTIRAFNAACAREKRRPNAVVHDHGTHFAGQFERQMHVLPSTTKSLPSTCHN